MSSILVPGSTTNLIHELRTLLTNAEELFAKRFGTAVASAVSLGKRGGGIEQWLMYDKGQLRYGCASNMSLLLNDCPAVALCDIAPRLQDLWDVLHASDTTRQLLAAVTAASDFVTKHKEET